jgi:hypothetical protein
LLQAQASATQNVAAEGSSEQVEKVIIRYPNPDAPLPLPEKAN